MMGRAAGFNLLEVLLVLSLLLVLSAGLLANLTGTSSELRVHLAASELVGVLRTARATAIRRGVKVGVKFRTVENGPVSYSLHRDGDGDGVLSRDIDSGVDPPIGPPRDLRHMGSLVRFGFPPGAAPRDPGDPRRRLGNLRDPIRFNRSDIASFGPLGGSTPGSLYLTDSKYRLAVVRLFGRTGRVRILHYDPATEKWS